MDSPTSSVFDLPTTFALRSRKRRYNIMLFPEDVARMDRRARQLGVSRSELLAFAFNRFDADCRDMGGDA